jgi:hypothetical protein
MLIGRDSGIKNTINIISPTKKGVMLGLSDTIEERRAM